MKVGKFRYLLDKSMYEGFQLFSRKEFAYAASDKLVYIRKFSTSGHEMTLSAVLQGHEAEVARV